MRKFFYGNFVQYDGYTGVQRGHGHSWYIQNPIALGEAGRTTLQDNIALRNFDIGLHIYSQEGQVAYITLDHNVEAVEGTMDRRFRLRGAREAVRHSFTRDASGQPATSCDPRVNPKLNLNPILSGNMTYDPTTAYSNVMGSSKGSCSATITNNYFASHNMIQFTNNGMYGTVTITGNTFMAAPDGSGGPAPLFTKANYPTNTYLSGFPASGKQLFYRPNLFEEGRGFVVVYNWDHSANVTIDLAQMGGFTGEQYRIFNYQDNDPWNSTRSRPEPVGIPAVPSAFRPPLRTSSSPEARPTARPRTRSLPIRVPSSSFTSCTRVGRRTRLRLRHTVVPSSTPKASGRDRAPLFWRVPRVESGIPRWCSG